MDSIIYTTVRANLASAMGRVCEDHEALIVTRNGAQSVVMLSLEDHQALEEPPIFHEHPPMQSACSMRRTTARRERNRAELVK